MKKNTIKNLRKILAGAILGSFAFAMSFVNVAHAAVSSSSITENFNGPALSASWPSFGGGTFTTAWNMLNVYATPTNAYRGISNATFTDLRNDAITIQTGNYAGFSGITSLEIYPWNISREFDSNFQYQWQILPASSQISGYARANGTSIQIGSATYNATTQSDYRFLRLRANPSTMFWDSSPDGFAWTNRFSTSTLNTTSWVPSSTTLGLLQGTWQVEANGNVIPTYDNINIIPPLATRPANLPPQAGVSGVGAMGF